MNKLTNASFSQLVVQYERLVYTVCFQLVRDAAAAEDLTQETFLSAYLHRDAIPPGYERQWLCRVATNKAKDYLQSAYQRHTLLPGEDNIPPGLSPPAEETVLRRSAAAEIRDLILHMRQPYQPVCRLCLLEEKTPEEAALALGRPFDGRGPDRPCPGGLPGGAGPPGAGGTSGLLRPVPPAVHRAAV